MSILRPGLYAPLPWVTALISRISYKDARKPAILKFPRSLSITKEGRWFIGVLFFIGIAAINTGNNLLYLMLATLLALIITSGIMSESTLRELRIERRLPKRVFKGMPARAIVKAINKKRIFPSFSFTVAEARTEGFSPGKAYFFKVPANREAVNSVEYIFSRRGKFRLECVKVKTRFPFGLFMKGKEETALDEITVFPDIRPIGSIAAPQPQGRRDGMSVSAKGQGSGLRGLREYTLSDDARHIHWRSAARSAKLLFKEFEKETANEITVIFLNYPAPEKEFEALVDEAASAVNFYMEKGYPVGLRTLGSEIKPAYGNAHLDSMLMELALIGPQGSGAPSVKAVFL